MQAVPRKDHDIFPEAASATADPRLRTLVYAAYAAKFIWTTSFVINDERYFSLFDDAMVSMQYARNLAEGNGLVWNAGGERVEGFTNFLWVLAMAGVHLLPVAPAKMSLFVQLMGAAFLTGNLIATVRLTREVSAMHVPRG
jgi:hypothetical protein